jgi:hypothetical protein
VAVRTFVIVKEIAGVTHYWIGKPDWRQQWTDRPYLARTFDTAAIARTVADTHAELCNSDQVKVVPTHERCERTS